MTDANIPALCSIDEFLKRDYDFIVVGGGTAGLVVAARLTENANVNVGILEAGPANIGDPMILTPAMYSKAIGNPKYDWLHKSVPQKSASNFAIDQPRGKGLGGSSAINYQMYVRGHQLDYDDWEKLGNKGWGFKDLLPYFTKHEHFDDPSGYSTKPNIPLETCMMPVAMERMGQSIQVSVLGDLHKRESGLLLRAHWILATAFGYELVEGEKSLDMLQDESELQAAMALYATKKSGPLSSGGAAVGFISYADLCTPSEMKELQELILTDKNTGHDDATKKIIADSVADHDYGSIQLVLLAATLDLRDPGSQVALLQPPPEQLGKHGLALAACLARPLSMGTIHITSSDPEIDPQIDPGYLTHPAGVELLTKGLQLLEKITATSPFKEKIKGRHHPVELDVGDKKSTEEYLRKTCETEYHPIGTVAMGKKGVGAVDYRLKVWGAKGVRVVDASVMPLHVSGNIVSTVYAIAEKASDLIKEDWEL
ncbi:hypothetical protein V491_04364 [Pseudogymnoascus sp. VKM F-3775]|nr:hypothetical protein V491_04364 [Pseudogymnoascus sp. VKM F-3775]